MKTLIRDEHDLLIKELVPEGEPIVISLEKAFKRQQFFDNCKKDFLHTSYLEVNLKKVTQKEPKKFEAGKNYHCQPFKIISPGPIREIVEPMIKHKWFAGGASGALHFWEYWEEMKKSKPVKDNIKEMKSECPAGFYLSPIQYYTRMACVHKSHNNQVSIGLRNDVLLSKQQKGNNERSWKEISYVGDYLLLFREL